MKQELNKDVVRTVFCVARSIDLLDCEESL